jgi:hypothetical protein
MPIICKHGLDERFCVTCQQARETEPLRRDALRETLPLRRDALRVTEEGKPALLLRTVLGSLNVTVLVLDGKTIRFETVKEISLRHPMTVISFNQRKVLNSFLDLALQRGYLFQPHQELTCREQVEGGPPRCTFDHSELSLEKGSLGCTQCGAYVCQCGRCLCGYAGENTLGQGLSCPPLPIPREERLEYVRVVRFCDLDLQRVSSTRKRKLLYLVSTNIQRRVPRR